MSLKIPKNIPDHINTSKYIHIKEKKTSKINRYNSLKQLSNGKRKSTLSQSSKNENEQFNKTFSKIPYNNNNSNINITNNNNYERNSNQSQRKIKNFILNRINYSNTIINGRTPLPIQRVQSKTHSFIK